MAIHLTEQARQDVTIGKGTIYLDSDTGELNVAGRTTPHIIPGVLYPAVSGNDINGNALGGSYVYGTAHTDGRKYYYTDIKGSKPIKDPRIGGHFGSQRHKTKSTQLLEQETATHGNDISSVDGRDWIRGYIDRTDYNDVGNHIVCSASGQFFEITGYFNDVNVIMYSSANRDFTYQLNGATASSAMGGASVTNPLTGRYVDSGSVHNLGLSESIPAINTVRINRNTGTLLVHAIELIAQDTSNRNNIQIPSQDVVSYGKKFTVSGTPHYDPFNGFTNGTSLHSEFVDTATSLGLDTAPGSSAKWAISSTNHIRPYQGGRVVKWVDSDGTIKTSVNMMPPNAQNISTTADSEITTPSATNTNYKPAFSDDAIDHSQAEVAKTFHWREFGNGNANGGQVTGSTGGSYKDFSMLSDATAATDMAFVMDDGLTSLSADDFYLHPTIGLNRYGTSDKAYVTFIGTGISWNTSLGIKHWVQNLPYGTHILELATDSSNGDAGTVKIDGVTVKSDFANSGDLHLYKWMIKDDITFHQPKRPPIPEDACVIADYMLMADYVKQTDCEASEISKGVRYVSGTRDHFCDSSSAFTNNVIMEQGAQFGLAGFQSSSTNDHSHATLHFFGTTGQSLVEASNASHTVNLPAGTATTETALDSTNNENDQITIAESVALGQTSIKTIMKGSYRFYGHHVVTPIHTSSHYQAFETPFLHELVGGDRNMEQTNLVVSPDGKTWDEVTRDTSYIGGGVLFTRSGNSYSGDTNVHINDDWRGKEQEKNFYNKDFAIAYDRVICLKDGQYVLHFQTYRNEGGDRDIKLNGGGFVRSYQIDAGTATAQVTVQLKRGDYLQTVGKQNTNSYVNFFWIKKA